MMKKSDKRNFLKTAFLAFLGLFASFSLFKRFMPAEEQERKSVKMLSEDGKLIEIDAEIFAAMQKRKASDEEMQEWVKK